jgi:class 3 adenylate cyclase
MGLSTGLLGVPYHGSISRISLARPEEESWLNCANCGATNDATHKFCFECGSALAAVCPSCGHSNAPGHKFCSECGGDLGAAEESKPALPAVDAASEPGERRFVSVLFADLVGFTSFSEGRDPEEVRAMLTRYFDVARQTIERFGGEVDKFIGDAVTAFWGAKQAQEDDAERAVRAALELVDTVDALGEELDIPELAVRAGVLSGETSVGSGGNEKGLVVGDIVNTASRLQSAADAGTVFVGDATKQLTEAAIRYELVGEQDMKGKSVRVTAWRAIDVLGQRGGKGRWVGLEAPFVGRDDELRLLKDQLHATTRDGHARMVSIVGQAGIGKSRLSWELLKYLDGINEVFRWHQGRSPAYGDGVTFWALGEMVRRRARIAETDEPLKARTKLRTAVAEYVPDPDEQRWIEPRLAGLLGLDEMPSGDRAELFNALRTFFQRVSETGTTVLLFEDLHWADTALLEFIEELVDRSPRHPILVVTLARQDLLEAHPQWGAARRNGMAVHLGPLPDARMGELVKGLVPGIPDDAVDLVVDQAAGIPLYAVEYVRMLLAGEQLVPDGDAYALAESLDSLAVPDSLHSVIAARLDRFSEQDRSLIQNASVLGHSFTVDGLAGLTRLPEADLDNRLAELIRQEIFRFEDDPDSPERGQYQFVQSLIKEVAYGRLAKAERRERHLRVAEYLDRLGDPELAPIIASHYASAYEAEPDDELAELARSSIAAAAERAADLKAHQQVLALTGQATAFAGDGEHRAQLELLAARAAHGLDREDDAAAYAEAAMALYAEAGNDSKALEAATELGTILNNYRRIDRAIEVLEPMYDPDGTGEVHAAFAATLARALMLSATRARESIPFSDAALIAAEASGDTALARYVLADALVSKGITFIYHGRPREGTILLQGGLRAAERADAALPQQRAIANLMEALAVDGMRPAFEPAASGLAAAVRGGGRYGIRFFAEHTAWGLAFQGRYDEAMELLREHDVDPVSRVDRPAAEYYVGWAQGDADVAPMQESIDALDVSSADPQREALVGESNAWIALLDRRYEDAITEAMGVNVGIDIFLVTPFVALAAALWKRDAESLERAASYAAEWPWPGKKVDRIALTTAAGRAALSGATADAVTRFTALIAHLQEYELDSEINHARVLFAYLVGQDVPEAKEAAELSYQWIMDTGSYGYLEAWKEGLPAQAAEAAG